MFIPPGGRGAAHPIEPYYVHHVYSTVIIPHIHPVHSVTVHHQRVIHQHIFPQQQSFAGNVIHHIEGRKLL